MNPHRCIGILTAGGDCPGLNAAIRAVAKSALHHDIQVVGFLDGFRGLVENRFMTLDDRMVSGILTVGGTILGSSRDKPHKMDMGGTVMDMTDVAITNARRMHLDCLVCLGGNGTQNNAFRLAKKGGVNIITLPKTIDNDVAMTDTCFGFDTAKSIATEAIDRLHTTATSHHRIIALELMGHTAGWLALGAGIAGGADVILIPEIPYDLRVIADFLNIRRQSGKRFSIIAVAEGATAIGSAPGKGNGVPGGKKNGKNKPEKTGDDGGADPAARQEPLMIREPMVNRIVRELQALTGVEARMTQLGHVQRGGTPTSADRLLCTRLGTTAGELIAARHYNVMVGVKGDTCVPVPLEQVAGIIRTVPIDHPWIRAARLVGTCMGDRPN
ncbi:MAG: ATP-dependent 6-phosphofructokinase [Lentisphaerae bacterium]|nr:ATP-dependent 6-phosphofructokinase [Lentisphaerota bacterium]